jgi:hypothetical protein
MAGFRIGQARPRKYRRAIMSNHNLFTLGADGAVVPASSKTILVAARQVLAHRVRRGASLQSPQQTGEYLTVHLGHLDYEVFGLIYPVVPPMVEYSLTPMGRLFIEPSDALSKLRRRRKKYTASRDKATSL